MAKIQGFNEKEQRIFNKMKDGEAHDFRELKKLFVDDAKARCKVTYEPGWGEAEIDSQAQSFARNSIRRLIRDGWVEQSGRGTYKLTRTGKNRVEKGADTTPSALTSKRGRKPGGEKKAASTSPKKTEKKSKAKPKKATKAMKSKAKETKVSKAKKTSPKKMQAMKAKVKKEATKDKMVSKAKKTSEKAKKENGHKDKINNVAKRAKQETTVEERLAQMSQPSNESEERVF